MDSSRAYSEAALSEEAETKTEEGDSQSGDRKLKKVTADPHIGLGIIFKSTPPQRENSSFVLNNGQHIPPQQQITWHWLLKRLLDSHKQEITTMVYLPVEKKAYS